MKLVVRGPHAARHDPFGNPLNSSKEAVNTDKR
jgi:hypothetical protein